MQMVEGGSSFLGCIGGSAFSVGIFIASAALAGPVLSVGAAAVMVLGLYGGIGFSCLT